MDLRPLNRMSRPRECRSIGRSICSQADVRMLAFSDRSGPGALLRFRSDSITCTRRLDTLSLAEPICAYATVSQALANELGIETPASGGLNSTIVDTSRNGWRRAYAVGTPQGRGGDTPRCSYTDDACPEQTLAGIEDPALAFHESRTGFFGASGPSAPVLQ